MAFMHACAEGIDTIVWALHADDLQNDVMNQKIQRLIKLHEDLASMQSSTRPRVQLPLADFTKQEVVELARTLDVELRTTFSCSDPQGNVSCESCPQCLAREEALMPPKNFAVL
jgi:7-cyano-7-deazaguanine synthase in queuosine biosynthesis